LEGADFVRSCPHPVADLLPHAPPMVLLEEVVGWDQGKVATALTIRSESPFFADGEGVPAYVGLEYMAQTCGVYAGIEAHNHARPVRLGFLLGTRNYHASKHWFRAGDRLVVEAVETFRQDGMGVFDCRITHEGEEIASARLNLFQPEENLSGTSGEMAERQNDE
jgi:predicted hotdog family 3-hydroxylacyl-ACP dehydratase